MAARVNVKFVVILSAVLVVVFVGVAGAFYVIQSRSGANYARQGDAALARGDIKAADNFYSRAVGKERTNVEWLLKWRDIRAQKIPESYSSYLDDYRMYSGGILRSLALVQRTNLQAHKDYLQDLYNSGSLSAVVEETNAALRFFDPERPPALRRFRGMALARLYASGIDFAEPDKFKIPLAKEDLEAALAENPRDADAAECLALWYTTSASKAKATLDNAAAARNSQAALKVMDDLVAANPGDPSSLALKLGQDVAAVENLEDPGNNPANLVRRKAAALEALRPRLGEVHRAYMAADPEKLTNLDIARFQVVAVRIDPKDGPALVGQVNDRALTKAPTNADLLARRAELAYMSGDLEGTIAILQTIIDLPRRPVSLDGLRLFDIRRRAIFAQTNAALALALKAPDQAATKAAIARAQTFRQKLALEVPEQSPELLFVDGKRLFIEGDLRGAQRTLTEFVRAPANLTNNLIEARLFLADAAVKLNETGIAREQLLQVLKQSPDSTEVLLSLAQVESTLQNRERAVEYLKRALDIDPDNQRARTNLEMLQAVSPGAGKLDDPVLQRIAEAQRIAQGTSNTIGNDAAAIEWLAKGLDANDHDPRLVSRVAEALPSAAPSPSSGPASPSTPATNSSPPCSNATRPPAPSKEPSPSSTNPASPPSTSGSTSGRPTSPAEKPPRPPTPWLRPPKPPRKTLWCWTSSSARPPPARISPRPPGSPRSPPAPTPTAPTATSSRHACSFSRATTAKPPIRSAAPPNGATQTRRSTASWAASSSSSATAPTR